MSDDAENSEKMTLRVDLTGNALQRFKAIKLYYGLKADSELVRILISEEYRRRFGEH